MYLCSRSRSLNFNNVMNNFISIDSHTQAIGIHFSLIQAKVTPETLGVDANPLGKTTLQDSPPQSKTTPEGMPLLSKTTPQNTPLLAKIAPQNTPRLSKGTPLGTPRLAKTAPLHTRPLVSTPPLRSQSGAPLRSALKSGRRQASRQSAAVRFAPSSPNEEETRTPSTPAPVVVRQGTPYREKRGEMM